MPALRTIASCLLVATTVGGCVLDSESSSEGAGADDAEYSNALATLQGSFGDEGKADSLGHVTACKLLEPLAAYSERGLRSGYLIGVEGAAVFGPAKGFGGMTVVFDLYHHQMTVLKYLGGGLTVPGVGAEINAYHGSVTGFEHGVGELLEPLGGNVGIHLGEPAEAARPGCDQVHGPDDQVHVRPIGQWAEP